MTAHTLFRFLHRPLTRWVVAPAAVVALTASVLGATGTMPRVLRDLSLASNPTPPANDAFTSASPIGATASFSGDTTGATTEVGEPNVATGDQTVWYSWTPGAPGTAYFVPGGSAPLPKVRVYTGSGLASLTEVDTQGTSAGTASIDALSGTTYRIQVDAPAGEAGAFSFDLLQPDSGAPLNDDFSNPTSLEQAVNARIAGTGTNPVGSGSTEGATGQAGEPGNPTHSVWYDWTAQVGGGSVTFTVAPTTAGAHLQIAAFTGSAVNTLAPVGTPATATTTVTVAPQSGVTYLLQVSGDQSYFDISADESGLTGPDTVAPTVTCTPATGWHSANVSVPCTASDSGSGLADPSQAAFDLITSLPVGAASATASTNSVTVCDKAGNCALAGPYTVEIDRAAPTVTCSSVPTTWSAGPVNVECDATDGPNGSGLAAPADATFTLTASIAPGTESSSVAFDTHGPVCDNAGNCTAVPTPPAARIDMAAPVVHCDPPPPGWHSGVVLTCTASDAGSGLEKSADASFTLSDDVPQGVQTANATSGTHQVCDLAGNCTTVGPIGPIEVDREPPHITCTAPTGWIKGNTATVPCTASDAGSGLAPGTPASFDLTANITPGTEGSTSTGTRQICDAVGNCATAGPYPVQLDDHGPQVSCQPTPTAWQEATASVTCTATDGGSGLANPADAAFTLTATVAAGSASSSVPMPQRQVCDTVGNCTETPALAPAQIDDQTPLVTCVNPSPGVHHGEVVVTCTATDQGGSGLEFPADASFTLETSVGAGKADSAAVTDSHPVCDAVGNCVTVGPLGPYDVDRTQGGEPPTLTAPHQIHVHAEVPSSRGEAASLGSGGVPVPYALPDGSSPSGLPTTIGCNPSPDASFPYGTTPVVCTVEDTDAQSSTSVVDVVVTPESGLAPQGTPIPGNPFNFAGDGFAPGSNVDLVLDGVILGTTTATGSGTFNTSFVLPAGTAPGPHTLNAAGLGTDGQPNLVVAPLAVALEAAPVTTTTAPPTNAPPTTAPPTTAPPTATQPTTTTPPTPTSGPAGSSPTIPAAGSGALGPVTAFTSAPSSLSPPTTSPKPTSPGGVTHFGGGAPQHSASGPLHPIPHGGSSQWWLAIVAAGLVAGAVVLLLIRRRRIL